MKLTVVVSILSLSLLLLSCHSNNGEIEIPESGFIEISKVQFQTENMAFGEPALSPFSDKIHFTGTIIPSVNGREQISLPLPGLIKKIYCKPGQSVEKGSLLFEISGNEFVDLQKDFAESNSVLKRLKSEYLRIKELYDAKIAAEKEFIQAESDFYSEQAKHNAFRIKLENLGLDATSVEKGIFLKSYQVRSPLHGFITIIDVTIGQFVEPYQRIAELIDANSYQLKISVFEKDIFKVKAGQAVDFFANGDKTQKYFASISTVGQNIMNDTKSIDCYAEIDKLTNRSLISNQFVEGDIYLAVDTVLSLPQTAMIKSETKSYILVLENENDENYYFKKVELAPGRKNNNFVELLGKIPSNKILINGVYNLQVE